jgi:hypothetical protein
MPKDEEHAGEQPVHRPAGGDRVAAEVRDRHAGKPVLPAGVGRQRGEFEEVAHLRESERDHGKIDADAAHGEPADDHTENPGRDRADGERQPDAAENVVHQQVGRDETAGAEERRLAERQQPGDSEQQVEAQSEQADVQHALQEIQRCADARQHERRNDEDQRQRRDRQQRGPPAGHTRPSDPNSPCGRSTSSSAMTA